MSVPINFNCTVRYLILLLIQVLTVASQRSPRPSREPTETTIQITSTESATNGTTTINSTETTTTPLETTTTTPLTTSTTPLTTGNIVTDEIIDQLLTSSQETDVWTIVYVLIGILVAIVATIIIAFAIYTVRKRLKTATFELQHQNAIPDGVYIDPALLVRKPAGVDVTTDAGDYVDPDHLYTEIQPDGSTKSRKRIINMSVKRDSGGYLLPNSTGSVKYETATVADSNQHEYQSLGISNDELKTAEPLTTDV